MKKFKKGLEIFASRSLFDCEISCELSCEVYVILLFDSVCDLPFCTSQVNPLPDKGVGFSFVYVAKGLSCMVHF
ncbi:hypothetical protein AM1BK_39530 [Neobacillus kokaensis]|uniref:Uncharacterized protein n=1 Tax=Neobacillus kokaensis TaxID=2759023 RepID=A0ABQ3N8Y0_9BACI|nr:hypothetical protein AM1BK_39530 [Neobacillus kokaensis]